MNAPGAGTPGPRDGSICPSCERFIGPASTCPYCEADSAQPPVWRILRYSALFLSLVGLVFLYLMARFREIPVIRIVDVNPMMNFGQVRVVGEVARNPFVSKDKADPDYVSFLVDDGSGQLRVAAYREVARDLLASNAVPRKGTTVDVTGSLNVAADGNHKLRLQSAAQLRVCTDAVPRRAGLEPAESGADAARERSD